MKQLWPKNKKGKELQLMGRREKVSFPELDLFDIEAKVDTGAYTSALHCHDIGLKNRNNKQVLCFKLLDPLHPDYNECEQIFEEYIQKEIKNSFGEKESRFIINTKIKIGRKIVKTQFSLTNRGSMRYPVLLGRKLLQKRFLVDVTSIYLLNP